jgi:uncharacterized membrane protein YciS (DUF1049 family)
VKDILIALLLIAIVILVFGAVNHDQRIDFNYIAGTWHDASTFALAGIGAGVTLFAGLTVAAVARMHVLEGRRKLEREVEQVYLRLRAAEAASPAAAEASRAAVGPIAAGVPAAGGDVAPAALPPAAAQAPPASQSHVAEVAATEPQAVGGTPAAAPPDGVGGDAADQS